MLDTAFIDSLRQSVETSEPVSKEVALQILNADPVHYPMIMAYANELRIKEFGPEIHNCSITNAKSGSCSEDCAFCAQSAHHKTKVESYKMRNSESLVASYDANIKNPIDRFGVVTSGEGLNGNDVDTLIEAIETKQIDGKSWCSSAGILEDADIKRLKAAGLTRFHHNIETAESHFPNICTTHSYQERLDMVKRVLDNGLSICCGGIIGLGESLEQRYELAKTVYDLGVDSIPVNFHVPVEGTKLDHLEILPPMEILKTISMFRFVNPKAEVKVCAGRIHLRDLQSMVFYAGATGIMVGDLLTIAGRGVKEDVQMLTDLEILAQ